MTATLGHSDGLHTLGGVDGTRGVAFRVYGIAAPQGSKRAYVRGGRAMLVESSAETLKPWRDSVTHAAVEAMDGALPLGQAYAPLELLVTFYMPAPATVKRPRPSVAPDLSKLVRAAEDALTAGGVWVDDARVVRTVSEEFYADAEHPPGADITIREMPR